MAIGSQRHRADALVVAAGVRVAQPARLHGCAEVNGRRVQQGADEPWLMSRSYQADVKLLRSNSSVDDKHLRFASSSDIAESLAVTA